MSSLKVFAYLLIAGDARKLCIVEKVDNTVAHCIGGVGWESGCGVWLPSTVEPPHTHTDLRLHDKVGFFI